MATVPFTRWHVRNYIDCSVNKLKEDLTEPSANTDYIKGQMAAFMSIKNAMSGALMEKLYEGHKEEPKPKANEVEEN